MIANCSGCSEKSTSCRAHPLLNVPICTNCWDAYHNGEFTISEDGNEMYCRWCGEGGNICYCDVCPKSFCVDCIQRNFGSAEMHRILQLQDRWSCFLCSPQALEDLCNKNGWDKLFSSSSIYCQLSSSSLSSTANQQRNGKKLNTSTLPTNCICLDVTNGREKFSIPVYNEVDDVDPPLDFVYVNKHVSGGPYMTNNPSFLSCCTCTDNCQNATRCECALLMKATFAYDDDKTLHYDQSNSGIYECNELCNCHVSRCLNRVIGNGPTIPLEVFRCSDTRKGWGLRASVDIPSGTYIADYIGEVIDEVNAERRGLVMGDEYLFNLDKFSRSQACQALSDLGFKNRPKMAKMGTKAGTNSNQNGLKIGQIDENFGSKLINDSSISSSSSSGNNNTSNISSNKNNYSSGSSTTINDGIECDYDTIDVALLSKQTIKNLLGDDIFGLLEKHKAIDRLRISYQQEVVKMTNGNNNNNFNNSSNSRSSSISNSNNNSISSSNNVKENTKKSISHTNSSSSNNNYVNSNSSSSSSTGLQFLPQLPSLVDILTTVDRDEERQISVQNRSNSNNNNNFINNASISTSSITKKTVYNITVTETNNSTLNTHSSSATTTAETVSTSANITVTSSGSSYKNIHNNNNNNNNKNSPSIIRESGEKRSIIVIDGSSSSDDNSSNNNTDDDDAITTSATTISSSPVVNSTKVQSTSNCKDIKNNALTSPPSPAVVKSLSTTTTTTFTVTTAASSNGNYSSGNSNNHNNNVSNNSDGNSSYSNNDINHQITVHPSLTLWLPFSKRRRVQLFRNACDTITDRAVLQAEKDFGSYTIDARWFGSVGRFLNHSCNPNLNIVTVFADTHNAQIPRVAFFSNEFIKAKTELVYDYGYYEGNVADKHRDCLCGAIQCRKVLY